MRWLDVRPVPRVVLDDPPLTEVICQFRFPPVLRLQSDQQLLASIQDRLRGDYPSLDAQAVLSLRIPGGPADAPLAAVGGPAWRFVDDTGNWLVSLAADFVALSTTSYSHWDDFTRRLRPVIQTVVELVGITSRRRLGLRYTNQIPIPQDAASWGQVIAPELVGWVAHLDPGVAVDSAVQEVRLRTDVCAVGFRHGPLPMTNDQSVRQYLLDTDCYLDEPTGVDIDDLIGSAGAFNDVANRFFFGALTADGLQKFKPRPKE